MIMELGRLPAFGAHMTLSAVFDFQDHLPLLQLQACRGHDPMVSKTE